MSSTAKTFCRTLRKRLTPQQRLNRSIRIIRRLPEPTSEQVTESSEEAERQRLININAKSGYKPSDWEDYH